MRIIRYETPNDIALGAVTDEDHVYRLPYQDFLELVNQAKTKGITTYQLVNQHIFDSLPETETYSELKLFVPIEADEVWAAGVTYQKSREARNFEATQGQLNVAETFYDKVYDAERPEIFLKSTKRRTAGPYDELCLRRDSQWQIPEPELALVINGQGEVLGYTIGNDMSCRDIEGDNPLYLPQAKIWKNSCSIGPAIRLAETVTNPYNFEITCRIFREDTIVFEGSANTNQLKRQYEELVNYLIYENSILDGTILLTGTAIVPPNDFTLSPNDRIEIEISGIGILSNSVINISSSNPTTSF